MLDLLDWIRGYASVDTMEYKSIVIFNVMVFN